tara:strand:+ start:851 stop:1804 length:954 start_codon:yes stop_codon:yes gene_type:complete
MIITPTQLKTTHLSGIPLVDEDGVAFDDALFEQAIAAAQRTVELDLGVTLTPFSVEGERHDVEAEDRQAFWPIDLDLRPVRSIKSIDISLGNYKKVSLPVEWVNLLDPDMGSCQLIATADTLGSFFFRSGLPILLGSVLSPYQYVPGYFSIDYDAGPLDIRGTGTIPQGETSVTVTHDVTNMPQQVSITAGVLNGGSTPVVSGRSSKSITFTSSTAPDAGDLTFDYVISTVDPAIKDAVSALASIIPLATAGDLPFGQAGVAGMSLSVDGLSQSVNTTASAMYNAYSARIKDIRKQYTVMMAALRTKYNRSPSLLVI